MPATGPGLGDVLDRTFRDWVPQFERRHDETPAFRGGSAAAEPDPMRRLFRTATGERAARAVGNESRTLPAFERLSLEIMALALRESRPHGSEERYLVTRARGGRVPVLMVLSPDVQDVGASRIISDDLDVPATYLHAFADKVVDREARTPEATVARELWSGGPAALRDLYVVAQPEVVLTRRPRMIPLCVPSPHMRVEQGVRISTAGVLCRDAEGEVGVTACYHGTGPVGTSVVVGQHNSRVKHANIVQDIVFIPLDNGAQPPPRTGLGGVRTDREPSRSEEVRFDGATNQNCTTRIFGTDYGLLRARPTVQLKVQTDPDTDEGDSGSALIDDNDRVLGFAFERTDYNDHPQFTDWIWAANALRSLGLTVF